MAATPRKFQEKIALINERAAQGTAAYEEIMQEVTSLRNQPRIVTQVQKRLSAHQQTQPLPNRTAHSGSLPDFSINLSPNRPSNYYYPYPQQGAVSDLLNLTQIYSGSGSSNSGDQATILGATRPHHSSMSNSAIHPSVSHRHLTPPDMLSRSSSDSSLHHTAFQNKMVNNPYRKGFITDDRHRHSQAGVVNYESRHQKPSEAASQAVEISMYNHLNRSSNIPIPTTAGNPCSGGGGPGAGPGGGGSLPDLTQVQFMPTPIPIPDLDAINQGSFSGGVATTGSFPRSSVPYMVRSPSSRGTSPGPSPRPSPNIDRKQKNKPYAHQSINSSQRNPKSCLSVPSNIPVNAHLHMSKGIVTNNSISPSADANAVISSGLGIYGGPLSPAGSHPTSPIPMPLMDYRNPVASPQNSPCASPVPTLVPPQTGPLTQYRCTSPDSRSSAPPSPVSLQQSSSPASSPGATLAKPFIYENFAQTQTTNQLNHQFQQINVHGDQLEGLGTAMDASGTTYYSNAGSASTSPGNGGSFTTMQSHCPSTTIPQKPSTQPLSTSPIPSSPSHSPVSPQGGTNTPLSQQPATPQTPQTPNVPLPRLIITDQDGNDDQNLLGEVPEISSFLFDDSIFQNLSSLGEDELMSVDQILVDNETEESFRRDLRNPQQEFMTLGEIQPSHFLPQQNTMDSSSGNCQSTQLPQSQSISIPSSGGRQGQPNHQQHGMATFYNVDQSMLLNSTEEMTILESLTSCNSTAETEAILSQIQDQGGLSHSNDFASQLDLGLGNPSSGVGWHQISEPNPQL